MKILIKCTRDILEEAKYCDGTVISKPVNGKIFDSSVAENCWIAVACQEIFPYCSVQTRTVGYTQDGRFDEIKEAYISNMARKASLAFKDVEYWEIILPKIALDSIQEFDDTNPMFRTEVLEPFEFTIDIDNKTLNTILEYNGVDLDAFIDAIVNSNNLELVEA